MPNLNVPPRQITATNGTSLNQQQTIAAFNVPAPPSPVVSLSSINAGFKVESARVLRDNLKDYFSVAFTDAAGAAKVFMFDLLPAIEHRGGGALRSLDVPEVKPGIMRAAETKHRNIVVPGSTPVVQSIGMKSILVNFVGAFTGAEGIGGDPQKRAAGKAAEDNLLGGYGITTDPAWSDSYARASEFYSQVVTPMTQVTVTLNASRGTEGITAMVYKGVIIKFKDYAARSNRTYYVLDMLVTEYAAAAPTATKEEAKKNE